MRTRLPEVGTVLAILLVIGSWTEGRQDPVPIEVHLVAGERVEQELELSPLERTRRLVVRPDFDGRLSVWAWSLELDPVLHVTTPSGELVGEDDDSGGRTTAYLRLDVEPGRELRIAVAASDADATGSVRIGLGASAETAASLTAAASARERIAEAEQLAASRRPDEARALLRETLDALLASEGAEASAAVAEAAWLLVRVAPAVGAVETEARALECMHAAASRTFPPDSPHLLLVRSFLARSLAERGDLRAALELEESVVRGLERTLPPDHAELLAARHNAAAYLAELGDHRGARALEEQVLAGLERTRPAGHPDLVAARVNLASSMEAMGDLPGARDLLQRALDAAESLPEDHVNILGAQSGLARMMKNLGDVAGARAIYERVLEAHERALPPDHPQVLSAKLSLATTLEGAHDRAAADALYEEVLSAYGRTLPEDHLLFLQARRSYALNRLHHGDFEGARAIDAHVLATAESALPAEHPFLDVTRVSLAITLKAVDDFEGARELEERVLAHRERVLPPDHPQVLLIRGNLAVTLFHLDERDAARTQIAALGSALRRRLGSAPTLSLREARLAAESAKHGLALALLAGAHEDATEEEVAAAFELAESARLMSTETHVSQRAIADDPELERLVREVRRVREELGERAAGAGRAGEARSGSPVEPGTLAELSLERDRLERELFARLGASDRHGPSVEVSALAAALPEGSAAVGYLRYPRWHVGPTSADASEEDHLLAHVVLPGGSLERVELGPARELESLVARWRTAAGRPLLARSRGVGPLSDPHADERQLDELGSELFARLLAPVLRAARGARSLHVCLDDVLFLVPLDALPHGDTHVGEQHDLRFSSSFASLLRARSPVRGRGLLLVGDVGYAAEPPLGSVLLAADVSPPIVASERYGGLDDPFVPLPETRAEVERISKLYAQRFDAEPVLLTGGGASKSQLAERVPGARFVHVATHGWFAAESVASTLDARRDRTGTLWSPLDVGETVTGLAPMTLCGLALAGANQGRDALGRVPGILTAEELAGLDLFACELAVLSACETNVGIARAGQGLQSLQAALHAAGARASITSLWKVDDEWTRKLMEDFYTRLWVDQEPKARALWNAKMALRRQGAATRDWAGWVLVGDPD